MNTMLRVLAAGAVCSAICAPTRALAVLPPIQHVFIIVLENKGFEETFGTPPSGSIKGRVSCTPYNHYSLLRSLEDIFGVEHLGYAGRDGLVAFGADVYSATPPQTCP